MLPFSKSLLVVSLGVGFGVAGCGSKDGKLKVTGIEPDRGDVQGGTLVAIKGSGFIEGGTHNAKVFFGKEPGTVVRFASDSELRVQAPGGKLNETVDVLIVFEPGGEKTLSKAFTFVEKGKGPSVEDLDTSKARSSDKK